MTQVKIAAAIEDDGSITKNEKVISRHLIIRHKLRDLGRLVLEMWNFLIIFILNTLLILQRK